MAVLGLSRVNVALGQSASQPAAFEVASLKPATGSVLGAADWASIGVQESMLDMVRPGILPVKGRTLFLRDWSLRSLIAGAYRVRPREVVGSDLTLDLRFTVDARIPEAAPRDKVNEMLQTLLAERFALRVHRETRDASGYALTVAKDGPKLRPSNSGQGTDPAADIGERMQRKMDDLKSELERTGTLTPGSSTQIRGATISNLAQSVAHLLQAPVEDLTGLTGRYDIEFRVPPPESSDDTAEHRVAAVLAKLGLKLGRRKVPVSFIVVDAVAAIPTAN